MHACVRLALLIVLWPLPGMAAESCGEDGFAGSSGMVDLRWDNDAFGNASQDHGYSNGMVVTGVSGDIASRSCLGWLDRGVGRYLDWAHPDMSGPQYRVATIKHDIYTPDDKTRSDLIEDDRPYVGALLLGLGYYAREGDRLYSNHLRVGMVGPSARGEQVQDAVHRVISVNPAMGWQHQLRDEPVVQLIHERFRRWPGNVTPHGAGRGWDVIGHAGGSLGNFATHANAGAEWRWGWHLPDDFGSTPLRSSHVYGARNEASRRRGLSGHLFASVDVRWVLRDITLDGNTFKSSHSVDKRPFVADLGYGVVVSHGRWKYTLAQYQRSREFDGQLEPPSFGSITVSRVF